MSAPVRHFIDLWKLSAEDLRSILDDAKARKAARKGWHKGRVDADAPLKERVLAMVFEKTDSGLVYAPPSMDLTNELVRTYNEKYPVKGGKPAPAAPAAKDAPVQ